MLSKLIKSVSPVSSDTYDLTSGTSIHFENFTKMIANELLFYLQRRCANKMLSLYFQHLLHYCCEASYTR